jgi:hypothetical protein
MSRTFRPPSFRWTLSSAQSFRRPIGRHSRRWLRRVVQDEHQGSSLLRPRDREPHGLTARHDYADSLLAHLLASRRLQACLSAFGVPSFRPRMTVDARLHPRSHDRFHVLRHVFRIRAHHQRADFCDTLPAFRPPSSLADREQPHLPERLNHRSAGAFGRLGRGTRRKLVQVPENGLLRQLPHWLIADDPAPYFICPFADRQTVRVDSLCRCRRKRSEFNHT